MADFRSSTLPRQFSQTFSQAPESNIIREKLANLNNGYERLKSLCLDHRDHLADIHDKQQKYLRSVDPTLPWLEQTYATLRNLLQEPIAAEPREVQEQIDQLKVSISRGNKILL